MDTGPNSTVWLKVEKGRVGGGNWEGRLGGGREERKGRRGQGRKVGYAHFKVTDPVVEKQISPPPQKKR